MFRKKTSVLKNQKDVSSCEKKKYDKCGLGGQPSSRTDADEDGYNVDEGHDPDPESLTMTKKLLTSLPDMKISLNQEETTTFTPTSPSAHFYPFASKSTPRFSTKTRDSAKPCWSTTSSSSLPTTLARMHNDRDKKQLKYNDTAFNFQDFSSILSLTPLPLPIANTDVLKFHLTLSDDKISVTDRNHHGHGSNHSNISNDFRLGNETETDPSSITEKVSIFPPPEQVELFDRVFTVTRAKVHLPPASPTRQQNILSTTRIKNYVSASSSPAYYEKDLHFITQQQNQGNLQIVNQNTKLESEMVLELEKENKPQRDEEDDKEKNSNTKTDSMGSYETESLNSTIESTIVTDSDIEDEADKVEVDEDDYDEGVELTMSERSNKNKSMNSISCSSFDILEVTLENPENPDMTLQAHPTQTNTVSPISRFFLNTRNILFKSRSIPTRSISEERPAPATPKRAKDAEFYQNRDRSKANVNNYGNNNYNNHNPYSNLYQYQYPFLYSQNASMSSIKTSKQSISTFDKLSLKKGKPSRNLASSKVVGLFQSSNFPAVMKSTNSGKVWLWNRPEDILVIQDDGRIVDPTVKATALKTKKQKWIKPKIMTSKNTLDESTSTTKSSKSYHGAIKSSLSKLYERFFVKKKEGPFCDFNSFSNTNKSLNFNLLNKPRGFKKWATTSLDRRDQGMKRTSGQSGTDTGLGSSTDSSNDLRNRRYRFHVSLSSYDILQSHEHE